MKNSKQQTRERLIAGAADLISRRGLNATSIRELAKFSGTPLGSTYHFFPGGKQQLVSEAIDFVGTQVTDSLRNALLSGPQEGVMAFLGLWRKIVINSNFQAGCPVLSVAVEEPSTEEEMALLRTAEKIFGEWKKLLADSMEQQGVPRTEAESIATLVVAAVEGTIALCRAARSIEPLDQISEQLSTVISAALKSHAE